VAPQPTLHTDEHTAGSVGAKARGWGRDTLLLRRFLKTTQLLKVRIGTVHSAL